MEEIFPQHAAAMSEIMGGLSVEEKKVAVNQLKKLGLYAQNLE